MKITKFEHACFVVEENGESLVIDPGAYTSDFVTPENVVAVMITHEHADHLDKDKLRAIAEKNPDVVFVGVKSVIQQLDGFNTQIVTANEGMKFGNFELDFHGGQHAVIAKEIPVIENLGVMINERIYYPGDSFTTPDRPVEVLALPVAAPWMKLSEAIDFVKVVKPKRVFPTHDAVLSDAGKALPDHIVPSLIKDLGIGYQRLSEPLEI